MPMLNDSHRRLVIGLLVFVLIVGGGQARPGGITGDEAVGGTDVAKTGCTCHSGDQADPDNSTKIYVIDVPNRYSGNEAYPMQIKIIGGPEVHSEGTDSTGGFSMRVSAGMLSASAGYEDMVANGDDTSTLTHTSAGKNPIDRAWSFTWTAPDSGSGDVVFWIAANSVNGNGNNAGDSWNRFSFPISEGNTTGVYTEYTGDGEAVDLDSGDDTIDIHKMGAKFRAHWLGLLGFGAVILVIIFCGFFLRYGFSRHYEGRSNLLRLRMKHLRRGDQL